MRVTWSWAWSRGLSRVSGAAPRRRRHAAWMVTVPLLTGLSTGTEGSAVHAAVACVCSVVVAVAAPCRGRAWVWLRGHVGGAAPRRLRRGCVDGDCASFDWY